MCLGRRLHLVSYGNLLLLIYLLGNIPVHLKPGSYDFCLQLQTLYAQHEIILFLWPARPTLMSKLHVVRRTLFVLLFDICSGCVNCLRWVTRICLVVYYRASFLMPLLYAWISASIMVFFFFVLMNTFRLRCVPFGLGLFVIGAVVSCSHREGRYES